LTERDFRSNFLPEYEGPIITGRLIDARTGEPSDEKPAILLGFAGEEQRVSGGQVNDDGQVSFYASQISGRRQLGFAFYPTTFAANGQSYRLDLLSPFATHTLERLPRFTLNSAWEEQLVQRSVGVQVMYSYLLDSLNLQAGMTPPYIRWKPDYTYILDEYNRFDRMNVMFVEFIPYLSFQTVRGRRVLSVMTSDFTFTSGSSLVLYDGIPVNNAEFFFNYNTRLIKRVDIYQGKYFFAGHIFEGIVSFTSFDNNSLGLISGDLMQLMVYEGTQPAYQFYAPSYKEDTSVAGSRIPDYRHTLLWNPDVSTDGQSAITLPFTTSDMTGDYRIIVEGITHDGQPLRGVTRFRVE
jgi:hypothetical protein